MLCSVLGSTVKKDKELLERPKMMEESRSSLSGGEALGAGPAQSREDSRNLINPSKFNPYKYLQDGCQEDGARFLLCPATGQGAVARN